IFPDIRDQHELHDLLHSLVALPLAVLTTELGGPGLDSETWDRGATNTRHWPLFFERLTQTGRAQIVDLNGIPCWTATERLPHIAALSHHAVILSGEVRASANLAVEGPAAPSDRDAAQQATESVTKEIAI